MTSDLFCFVLFAAFKFIVMKIGRNRNFAGNENDRNEVGSKLKRAEQIINETCYF